MRFREQSSFARAFSVDLGNACDRAGFEVRGYIWVRSDVEAGHPRPKAARKGNAELKADGRGRCRVDVNQDVFEAHAQPLPHHVTNMIVTVTAIVAVDSQPITHSGRGSVNAPITLGRMVISIMTTISGTATTPFMTALQNR